MSGSGQSFHSKGTHWVLCACCSFKRWEPNGEHWCISPLETRTHAHMLINDGQVFRRKITTRPYDRLIWSLHRVVKTFLGNEQLAVTQNIQLKMRSILWAAHQLEAHMSWCFRVLCVTKKIMRNHAKTDFFSFFYQTYKFKNNRNKLIDLSLWTTESSVQQTHHKMPKQVWIQWQCLWGSAWWKASSLEDVNYGKTIDSTLNIKEAWQMFSPQRPISKG